MATRYFIIHGVCAPRYEYIAAVAKFDHFPRLYELRRALATQIDERPARVRVTGWNEVDKDDANEYLESDDEDSDSEASESTPPAGPAVDYILL